MHTHTHLLSLRDSVLEILYENLLGTANAIFSGMFRVFHALYVGECQLNHIANESLNIVNYFLSVSNNVFFSRQKQKFQLMGDISSKNMFK